MHFTWLAIWSHILRYENFLDLGEARSRTEQDLVLGRLGTLRRIVRWFDFCDLLSRAHGRVLV